MLTSNQSIQLFVADISVFPLSGRRDQQSRKAAKYIYSSTVSFSFSFSFIYLFYFVLFLLLKYNFLFIYLFYYFFYLSTILRYLYFYFLLLIFLLCYISEGHVVLFTAQYLSDNFTYFADSD